MASDKKSCSDALNSTTRLEVLDIFHWVSSGMTSFARGLNDAPKIAALAFGISIGSFETQLNTVFYFVLIALAMGVGSIISGLRVTETLAEKVTTMNHEEGFIANLTTSLLVTVAARFGFPVSTTHVSSSAIIGVGLNRSKKINWKVVSEMILAWIVTLPVAALISFVAYWVLIKIY